MIKFSQSGKPLNFERKYTGSALQVLAKPTGFPLQSGATMSNLLPIKLHEISKA